MQENILLKPREEIKLIRGYEGLYSITSFGRVWIHIRYARSKKNLIRKCGGKFSKLSEDKYGYLVCGLTKDCKHKTFKIHRLVAQEFISNLLNLPEVNHKDGNKQNNHVDNLEWCTRQGNVNHSIIKGFKGFKKTSKYYGVFKNKKLKYNRNPWVASIKVKCKVIYLGGYRTEIEAAKAYNDYIIKNNLDRLLNYINEGKYLKAIKETKNLVRYRGVSLIKKYNLKNPWMAQIYINKKLIYLGLYSTEMEAAKAYNNYVLLHNINKPLNYFMR